MDLSSLNILDKPEYVFRPAQIVRRLLRGRAAVGKGDFAEAVLPWGLKIRFNPRELIGASIWRMGIYDLCVSEAIWRLLDIGESALDAGANIGHMASAMAARVGPAGTVTAFEPHPEIFEALAANIRAWKGSPRVGRIEARRVALSDTAGTAVLSISDDFEQNQGGSYLVSNDDARRPPASRNTKGRSFPVQTSRLDDMIGSGCRIGLMKIDVEGHEIAVLQGGVGLFDQHRIRDVVFEEHNPYPTPVTEFLEARGYVLFQIAKRFSGLEVRSTAEPPVRKGRSYEPPNYVATIDPERALKRLRRRGWSVFADAR